MVLFLGVACVHCDFDMKVADKKGCPSVFIGFMMKDIRRGMLKAVMLELLREEDMDYSTVPRLGLR